MTPPPLTQTRPHEELCVALPSSRRATLSVRLPLQERVMRCAKGHTLVDDRPLPQDQAEQGQDLRSDDPRADRDRRARSAQSREPRADKPAAKRPASRRRRPQRDERRARVDEAAARLACAPSASQRLCSSATPPCRSAPRRLVGNRLGTPATSSASRRSASIQLRRRPAGALAVVRAAPSRPSRRGSGARALDRRLRLRTRRGWSERSASPGSPATSVNRAPLSAACRAISRNAAHHAPARA